MEWGYEMHGGYDTWWILLHAAFFLVLTIMGVMKRRQGLVRLVV